jgi:hypothetical protein
VKSIIAGLVLGIATVTPAVAQTTIVAATISESSIRKLPDGIPEGLFHKMFSSHSLVGSPGLAWKKQRVVTVAFCGGSDGLYSLIEQTANEWTSLGGQLKFSFQDKLGHYRQWTTSDKSPAANIRIAFNSDTNGGYWSLLGILAKHAEPNEPTMNFEGFPESLRRYFNRQNASEWGKSYEHTTVLHEFGHALGLSHEHFHPQCQQDMKMDIIIAYLMGPPNNWSKEQARFNIDAQYYIQILGKQAGSIESKLVTSPTTDQASVMLYQFPASYYLSGEKSVCIPIAGNDTVYPTNLSASDKEFYLENYKTIPSPFGGN